MPMMSVDRSLSQMTLTMLKSDLVKLIASQHPNLPIEAAESLVARFFDQIIVHLAAGGRVEIRGFGTFSTRSREQRTGRNPRTSEPVEVGAKRVPYFKPGKDLRERILASFRPA